MSSGVGKVPPPFSGPWTASWVAPRGAEQGYGVYLFRLELELALAGEPFAVAVSADNRYKLWVNGTLVARGPARGDVEHWYYETLELGTLLKQGTNVLAAIVWNHADLAPQAQVSLRTGFLVQGRSEREAPLVDTGRAAWRCRELLAIGPLPLPPLLARKYMAVGRGERCEAAAYPWGWQRLGFEVAGWELPEVLGLAEGHTDPVTDNTWLLEPRDIPLMEERPVRFESLRQHSGLEVPEGFLRGASPLEVAPNTKASLLLDMAELVTAYPALTCSGGAGAVVRLRYAENLWVDEELREKRHRDEIEGMVLVGHTDEFHADGGTQRFFEPLWWRTYRYVALEVETSADALTIHDLSGTFTAYPFNRTAHFESDLPELEKILEVGWRTARLCAHETYVDCPYYEQLQYAGDTRVQGLISLFNTGDHRLLRRAIRHFDQSRRGDGLTTSRYPARSRQYIPIFSLLWIGMVHDYFRYRDEPEFIRSCLPGVRQVLAWFERLQGEGGSLRSVPYWGYVDWVPGWRGGCAPGPTGVPRWAGGERAGARAPEAGEASAIFDLFLLLAYQWASELEALAGYNALGELWAKRAEQLTNTARSLYWDEQRGLFADDEAHASFSQHANILAVLAGIGSPAQAAAIMQKVLAEPDLTQATIYFRFYLAQALRKAGLGEEYLEQLGPWRRMLELGLTTFAETEEPSRSDCHAWSASPNIELFRTVLGIDSLAPGWTRVGVAPALGKLERASGRVPHPKGEISAAYERSAEGLAVELSVPVPAEFRWGAEVRELPAGEHHFRLRSKGT
jgi:alpha-L-rhamnosidase